MTSKRINILAVNNNQEEVKYIQKYEDHEKISVFHVGTGFEAISVLNKYEFDAVLIDLNITDIDTEELLYTIRETLQINWPPISITASPGHEAKIEKLLNIGVYGYIIKPFTILNLKSTINQIKQSNILNKQTHIEKENLKHEAKELHKIFKHSPVAMLTADAQARITNLNSQAESFLNIESKSVIGKLAGDTIKCIHALKQPESCGTYSHCKKCGLRTAIEETLVSKQPIKKRLAEFETIHNNYHRKLYLKISTIFYDHNDSKVLLILDDITMDYRYRNKLEQLNTRLYQQSVKLRSLTTELLKKNDALEASEAKIKAIFNLANVGISLTDKDGKYKFFNTWWAEKLGYTPKELKQLTNLDITANAHKIKTQKYFVELLQGIRKAYRMEKQYVKKDGSLFWAELSVSGIQNKDKTEGIVGIVADITDKKRAQQEIEEKNTILKEHIDTKDRFISILAHDLKNPFSTILNFSDLLNTNFNIYNDSEKKNFINLIYTSSHKAFQLLESLLKWSRAQKNATPFSPVKTNMLDLLNEILNLEDENIEQKNLHIKNYVLKPIYTYSDIDMIAVVMRNLISNAIKFTPQNGLISIDIQADGEKIKVSIADSGIGMSQKIKENLFNVSETRSHADTNGKKGSGFGLLLAAEFIQKHEGEIWVDSKQGEGSTFYFTLPLYKAQEKEKKQKNHI